MLRGQLNIMKLQGLKFDIDLTRAWIAQRHKIDPLPMIQTVDGLLCLR